MLQPESLDRFPDARRDRARVNRWALTALPASTIVERRPKSIRPIAVVSIFCNAPCCASCAREAKSRRTISLLSERPLLFRLAGDVPE
jgi:hypothetical protein